MLQSFYDLRDIDEAKLLLERLKISRLGFFRPVIVNLQTFEEARKKEPLLKIGGPGRIVVFRDAALVTELHGRFHRVLGPGRHDLTRFEFPRTLVDLRPQERESSEIKLMTSDGIQLKTSLTVTFEVLRGDQEPTKHKPFPYEEDAVRMVAYTETVEPGGAIGRWESLPMLITAGQLRTIVAEDPLDELILSETNGIDVHRRLQKEMERRARNVLRNYGIMVRGTRLGALELPKEVEDQRKKYWQARWDTQRALQKADGDAEILESKEFARAEAEATMLRAIAEGLQRARRAGRNVSSREVVALRLIESLEAMAKSSEQVVALPDRLIPNLGNIREQLMLTSGQSEETASQEQ
jgi:regulator of protease activity HflC (stomatin/prohibitin superfamily)